MPKYEVLHSHIMTPTGNYERGRVLDTKDFNAINLPMDFLLQNGVIGVLRGTESESDVIMNAIAGGTVNPVSGGSPASEMDAAGSGVSIAVQPETLPITEQTVKDAKASK